MAEGDYTSRKSVVILLNKPVPYELPASKSELKEVSYNNCSLLRREKTPVSKNPSKLMTKFGCKPKIIFIPYVQHGPIFLEKQVLELNLLNQQSVSRNGMEVQYQS
mmetsp:Transcript_2129/g.3144  ORF Transcript_2129/g.3144 Transcript_2129/m.3144 type:complete len:106 (+) Transcript_2129:2985-3302(+)